MTIMDYQELLDTEEWQSKSMAIRKRDHHTCQLCGGHEYLNVHHKYYVLSLYPWEYPDDALVTLCSDCHSKIHQVSSIVVYSDENLCKVMRYTPCKRCNGTGYLYEYRHIRNGICFRCMGARYEELINWEGRDKTDEINYNIQIHKKNWDDYTYIDLTSQNLENGCYVNEFYELHNVKEKLFKIKTFETNNGEEFKVLGLSTGEIDEKGKMIYKWFKPCKELLKDEHVLSKGFLREHKKEMCIVLPENIDNSSYGSYYLDWMFQ